MLLAGVDGLNSSDQWARFAVIKYDVNSGQWLFSARRWHNTTLSYLCQLQRGLLNDDIYCPIV